MYSMRLVKRQQIVRLYTLVRLVNSRFEAIDPVSESLRAYLSRVSVYLRKYTT
jgi:hypothetical protein